MLYLHLSAIDFEQCVQTMTQLSSTKLQKYLSLDILLTMLQNELTLPIHFDYYLILLQQSPNLR